MEKSLKKNYNEFKVAKMAISFFIFIQRNRVWGGRKMIWHSHCGLLLLLVEKPVYTSHYDKPIFKKQLSHFNCFSTEGLGITTIPAIYLYHLLESWRICNIVWPNLVGCELLFYCLPFKVYSLQHSRAGYRSVFSIRYSYRYKLIDIRCIIWYMR